MKSTKNLSKVYKYLQGRSGKTESAERRGWRLARYTSLRLSCEVMTPSESAFLERAVVQLLFVAGREFSIESLREKLRELFVQEADSTMRAAASVRSFELLQVLLKATQKLEKMGLRLDMRAGGVRITTAEVRPPALRDYFVALAEQTRNEAAEGTAAIGQEEAEGPLSTTGLEVLACIAFKQPLSLPEINGYFTTDKRAVVHRLQHLGLVDCRKAGETGRTVWMTTGEFLRRFNLCSPSDLDRLFQSNDNLKLA